MKKYMPLGVSLLLLWSTVAAALWLSLKHTGGHFVYLRDDPYIHMAMARNMAEHGIWGITKYGFSSASSSILWTLLLAAVYRGIGNGLAAPLAINIFLASLACIFFFTLLRKCKFGTPAVLLILISIVFLTPLPWLIFCGQEHILHLILTIAFVYLAAKSLESAETPLKDIPVLAVLAALLTLSRYEGIFLLFAAFCLFIARKRPLQGLIIGAAGLLPVLVYGMMSLSRGWYFFPNSVLLKGNMPDYHSIKGVLELAGYTGLQQMARNPQVLNLFVPAAVLLFIQRNRGQTIWNTSSMMTIMFLITTLLHIQFAAAGGIFRYEAYLVALGIFVIAVLLKEAAGGGFRYAALGRSLSARLALLSALAVFLSPFIVRGAVSLIWIPRACTNIYEQQYQMGLFIKNFYQHETVSLNDVGLRQLYGGHSLPRSVGARKHGYGQSPET